MGGWDLGGLDYIMGYKSSTSTKKLMVIRWNLIQHNDEHKYTLTRDMFHVVKFGKMASLKQNKAQLRKHHFQSNFLQKYIDAMCENDWPALCHVNLFLSWITMMAENCMIHFRWTTSWFGMPFSCNF
jgi:hypothetical protein